MKKEFKFKGVVEKFSLPAAWYFVLVPENIFKSVKLLKPKTIGYGFFPVHVTLGKTTWQTSLLPMGKKSGEKRFFIAIKAKVRKEEMVDLGDKVSIKFSLV